MVIGWVFTACAILLAVLAGDAPGRVLLAVAALAAGLLSLHGTLARPRLAVDETGVTVRGLTRTRHWSWDRVSVRVVHTRRLGRQSAMLELDVQDQDGSGENGGEELVVLSRLDLAADPEDVADALAGLRPAG
ncbi:PH domain-containing protein [Goodfellowiella coeruleoviolacea]|uniref:PH domain-containing protein n=1 Tax=Goodfellowiella coeruleoviolacea TaxID=334858 RepID=A0AAE3GKM4_9PSEU|nr:PH domain-containing protein [Goodfellowiella coeruleoviolacea]